VDCRTSFTLPRISYNNRVESTRLFHRKNRGHGVQNDQQHESCQQSHSVRMCTNNIAQSKVFVCRKSCEFPSNTCILSKKRRIHSKITTTTTTMVSSWPPMSIWTFMLGILLMTNITCQTCDAQQQHHHHHNRYSNKAMLTILDFTLWSYRAEIADFGNPMHKEDGRLKYHATLMIPPANYSQLCQIPDSLTTAAAEVLSDSPTTTLLSYPFDNNTSTENVVEEIANQDATESLTLTPAPGTTDAPCQFCGPIALLVSLGGCDAMTKVQVIVDIHQRVTSDLRYIVFYNNDPKDPDNIATVSVSTTLAPLNATSNQQNSTFNPWTVKQQKILDEKLVSCCFLIFECCCIM
jgi:hypothetical protein